MVVAVTIFRLLQAETVEDGPTSAVWVWPLRSISPDSKALTVASESGAVVDPVDAVQSSTSPPHQEPSGRRRTDAFTPTSKAVSSNRPVPIGCSASVLPAASKPRCDEGRIVGHRRHDGDVGARQRQHHGMVVLDGDGVRWPPSWCPGSMSAPMRPAMELPGGILVAPACDVEGRRPRR